MVFGLCMIVKNEAKIITKCLESVAPYIGRYDICDTGSTDNTVQIIRDFFKDKNIPGTVYQHDWEGFSINRSKAFSESEPRCDWIYVIDADDTLITPLVIPPECQHADSLAIQLEEGEFVTQYRQQLFKVKNLWGYEAVVHEYPYSRKKRYPIVMQTTKIKVRASRGGDRSKDPLKYWKDAMAMEKDLKRVEGLKRLHHWEENLASRYHYYIAQSYYDFHDYESCIKWCEKRVELKGFKEEIYRAYLIRARSLLALKADPKVVIRAFEETHNNDMFRCEAAYELCKIYQMLKEYHKAWDWCQKLLTIKKPTDKLFIVEDFVYGFGRYEQASTLCVHLGKYEMAYKYAMMLYGECKNNSHREYVKGVVNKIIPELTKIYSRIFPINIHESGSNDVVVNFSINHPQTLYSFIATCLDYHEIDQWYCTVDLPQFPFLKKGSSTGDKMTINISDCIFFHKTKLIDLIKSEKEQTAQKNLIKEKELSMYNLKKAGSDIGQLTDILNEIMILKRGLIDMKILYLNNEKGLNTGLQKITTVIDSPYVSFPTGSGVYSLDLHTSVIFNMTEVVL